MTKLLKATILILAIGLFSCTEEDGDVCTSDNVCDPDQLEQIVTVCEDGAGNQTYMVGGETYDTIGEANAAATCSATSQANIMNRLMILSNNASKTNL